jgi:hypothetical protein
MENIRTKMENKSVAEMMTKNYLKQLKQTL